MNGTNHPTNSASVRPSANCFIRSLTSLITSKGNPSCRLVCCHQSCPQRHYCWPWCRCRWGESPGSVTGTVPGSVDSASTPLSPGPGVYLPTQSQALYRSASSSPSAAAAHSPSSYFDIDNEEANARENVVVTDGHANVHTIVIVTVSTLDSNVDFNCTHLLSSLSPLPSPLVSPPSLGAAGEPI